MLVRQLNFSFKEHDLALMCTIRLSNQRTRAILSAGFQFKRESNLITSITRREFVMKSLGTYSEYDGTSFHKTDAPHKNVQ